MHPFTALSPTMSTNISSFVSAPFRPFLAWSAPLSVSLPLLLAASALATAADAQTKPTVAPPAADTPIALSNFVVTATRNAVAIADVPSRVEVIGAFDLAAQPGPYVTDTLKKNSSVDVIEYPGGISGVGIRGFRPEFSGTNQRTLLLVDGRPAGVSHLGNIPNAALDRIEVLKGSASSLYGASAMGGVVNFITRRSTGPIHGHISAGLGSFETVRADAALGGSVGRFDFDLAAQTRTQFDNFRMGNSETRPNTSFANHSGFARLGFALSPQWRIEARTHLFLALDSEGPGAYTDGTTAQSSRNTTLRSGDVRLEGDLERHQIRATLHGTSEYDKTRDETAGRAPFRSGIRTTTFRGLQLQDSWRLLDPLTVTFGSDYDYVKTIYQTYLITGARTRPTTPDNARETFAYFADASAKLFNGSLVLNAGARYDSIDTIVRATPLNTIVVPGTSRFTTTNPRAGIVWTPVPAWRLHGTAGRAFVSPLANQVAGYTEEFAASQRRIGRGNPALSPESAWSYDAGLGWESRWLSADATLFQTDVQDKIESVIVINTPLLRETTYVNASTAKSTGLELTLAADVGRLWAGRWRITSGYTRLYRREQTLPAGPTILRNVAKEKLNAAFVFTAPQLSTRLGARYVRGMWDQDFSRLLVFTNGRGGLFEFPTLVVWDAHVAWRVVKNQEIIVQADNLFDRYYYEKNDYPFQGRALSVRYRFSF